MASTKQTLSLDFTDPVEGLEELSAMIGRHPALAKPVLAECVRFVDDCERRLTDDWFIFEWRGPRLVCVGTPRFNALLANVRAATKP